MEGPPAAAALCALLPQWLSLFCARTVCARTHRFACEEETWRAWSKAKQSKGMASNHHHAAEPLDEEDEVVDRPRPRRRFRGLHWRHASQTYTPPPPPTQPQYSAPQLRPLSLSLGQSGFDGLDTIHSPPVAASTSAAAVISPETPPSAGSYSYNPLRRCINR